jgi:hypothetical protein
VDVEFQQVEEFVSYEVNGAIYVALDAEVQFEGAAGFVAGRKGNVLELIGGVGDLGVGVSIDWELGFECN